METYMCEIGDKKYIFHEEKWVTAGNVTAPTALWPALNQKLLSDIDFDSITYEELRDWVDRLKVHDNVVLAEKVLAIALEKAAKGGEVLEIRGLLPRATSLLRKEHKAKDAIDLAKNSIDAYGPSVETTVLYTSLAAAYIDVGDYEAALKSANRAYAMSGGKGSAELTAVYSRLRTLLGED